jgi:hypothetical protein
MSRILRELDHIVAEALGMAALRGRRLVAVTIAMRDPNETVRADVEHVLAGAKAYAVDVALVPGDGPMRLVAVELRSG